MSCISTKNLSSLPNKIFPNKNTCTTTTIAPNNYSNNLPKCNDVASVEKYIGDIYNNTFCSIPENESSGSTITDLEKCYINQFQERNIDFQCLDVPQLITRPKKESGLPIFHKQTI